MMGCRILPAVRKTPPTKTSPDMTPIIPMLATLLALGLAVLAGALIRRRKTPSSPLPEHIDALLPQTQCGQCGYPGCMPYAQAIAAGQAEINQCPPGGDRTIRSLAKLLTRDPMPLDLARGRHKPRAVALIDETACIGCTLCIQACPVDAIVGAAKRMHTVIAAECTGCELCIPPCPVDCIEMEPAKPDTWRWPFTESPRRLARQRANLARRRHNTRQRRLASEQRAREARLARKRLADAPQPSASDPRQIAIQAAIERVKVKKAAIKAAAKPSPQDAD
ncbi:electron transport complex subunit RsxB [Acidihalobacter yilgarnensis]|uniref:Ion-translocating oxidoreductase complex subunit B n=1 Tax=Acidihalobacter yilgarnensis TaxID=2819280 RepID=A0A1D8IR33_9GAMM|nr:electron transport complex subunit RsxB [Acidihalobacter yilgarnensis]